MRGIIPPWPPKLHSESLPPERVRWGSSLGYVPATKELKVGNESGMITINSLLDQSGLDLRATRLVRHQDKRGPAGRTPYHLWLAADGTFERYQAIQGSERFPVGGAIASFVVTPMLETVFVGAFTVDGIGTVPNGSTDPLGGHDVTGLHLYEMTPHEALAEYRGRIIVNWGPGARAWVQRAQTQIKPVVEITRTHSDPPFPGFDGFIGTIGSLAIVPKTWRTALALARGVYLLTSIVSGKQYVGMANGSDGFWGRWMAYAANGHGGNLGLQGTAKEDYHVTILEVAGSYATVEDVLALEQKWKLKLQSKLYGANRN